MTELGDRADAIRKREVMPEEDNMLKVCMDGRKAAWTCGSSAGP